MKIEIKIRALLDPKATAGEAQLGRSRWSAYLPESS